MGNVFGRDKPLKEVLRENKRMINKAVRELDREKTALEREEKRLTIEIKKAAKEQQMAAVKIMAKVGERRQSVVIFIDADAASLTARFCLVASIFRTLSERGSTLPNLLRCEVIYKAAH